MRTFAQGLANVSITATTSFNVVRPAGEACHILINHTARSESSNRYRHLSNVTRIRIDSLHVREISLYELIDSALGPPNSSFLQFAHDGLACKRDNWNARGSSGDSSGEREVARAETAAEAPEGHRGARHRAHQRETA